LRTFLSRILIVPWIFFSDRERSHRSTPPGIKQGLNDSKRSPSLFSMKNIVLKSVRLPSVRLVAGLSTLALLTAPLGACKRLPDENEQRAETARAYPPASRPVSELAGNQWSTETARDKRGEAEEIMKAAGLMPGMTVADIGAGEGYYTVRLAERVGTKGRVLAQDIDEGAIDRLAERVNRDALNNVSIKLGAPDDPRLPENSFDRIFLVHMYHEVREPYAFLSRLRPALLDKRGPNGAGEVIVVDVNRDVSQHGIPPKQLFCEFEAVGYELVGFMERPELGGYFARFRAKGSAILPGDIIPCPYQRDSG
tara:strand:- start:742 stop:1671 length:930 start_codon:yes stop_codon:yes gene_type:complete